MSLHGLADMRPIVDRDPDAVAWDGATWVGQVDEADLTGGCVHLVGGEEFSTARLLVWSRGVPRGFVEVPTDSGVVETARVRREVDTLPDVVVRNRTPYTPAITVVVCTRDRPGPLHDVLESLSGLDYPVFELLVVDNNPGSGLTPPVVERFDWAPIRLVEAPGQGLSIARNTALKNARHGIVAFTDDDVVVDRSWLTNLASGFASDERVACVCGMVPSAELTTPAQSYFDRRVGWARTCEPATYDLKVPPEDDPLFPLRVARYGTGANFAVRKGAILDLGGFDECMGIGSPTGGGEDIDMFVRVLLAGMQLVREPSAVVWHRHRRAAAELEVQIHNYGLGLGAWIAKLISRPRTLGMVLRRLAPGIRHLRTVTVVDQSDTADNDPALNGLDRAEFKGVIAGPSALLRARASGRSGKPLKVASNPLSKAVDFRRGQNWGEPGNNIAAGRLAMASVYLGVFGLLGVIDGLPTSLKVVLVGSFALGAPGCLILSWYTQLPAVARASLLPATSLAVCCLVISLLLMAGFFDPPVVMLGLAAACVIGGLLRCVFLAKRVGTQS